MQKARHHCKVWSRRKEPDDAKDALSYIYIVIYDVLCSDDLSSWILASCQLHRVTRMLNKRKPEKTTDIRKCSRMNCRSASLLALTEGETESVRMQRYIITCSKEEGNRKCEDAVVYCYLLWRRRKQKVWRCSSTLLVLWRRRKQKVWRCSSTLLLAPKERKTESVKMQLYIITCSEGEGNRKCEDAVVHCYLLRRRGKQKVWRCSSILLLAPKERETESVKMQ